MPGVKFDKDTSALWYKPNISREQSECTPQCSRTKKHAVIVSGKALNPSTSLVLVTDSF